MANRDGALAPKEPIRLFLSGGGNRAALGAVGMVAALVELGEWSNVREVVSVSGGSLPNAVLATVPDDPEPALGAMAQRMLDDGMRVTAGGRRLALVSLVPLLLALIGLGVAIAAGAGPWSPPGWVALVAGLLAVPVALTGGRRIFAALWRQVVGNAVGPIAARPLISVAPDQRTHLFCSAGLSSGVPYTFWAGTKEPAVRWGERLREGYTVADAVVASSSLPGLGRVRAPQELRAERLVDGGVAGIFGQQAIEGPARTARHTFRGDRRMVVLDAGRHSVSEGRVGKLLAPMSVLYTLSRWLKASLEATYVNDLADWNGGALVRLCRDPSMPPNDGPLGPVLQRLAEHTTRLGLRDLGSEMALDAVVAGFAATLVELRPQVTAAAMQDALARHGQALGFGDRLVARWSHHATATTVLSAE